MLITWFSLNDIVRLNFLNWAPDPRASSRSNAMIDVMQTCPEPMAKPLKLTAVGFIKSKCRLFGLSLNDVWIFFLMA